MVARDDAELIRRWSPVRELRETFFLLAFTASSLSAFVGLGVLAVRLIASGR
jgi:hypothetical protein